jgi:hypothetical protein
MCQYLSLFKIEFRNIKINFVDGDGKPESEDGKPESHKVREWHKIVNSKWLNCKYLWL